MTPADQLTARPQPGRPLTAEDCHLLRPGDVLRSADLVGVMKGVADGWGCATLIAPNGAEFSRIVHKGYTFIGRPDADGWMPWSGGENPVPGQRVEVKIRWRDGVASEWPVESDVMRWKHRRGRDGGGDIIAFRLSRPVSTPPVESAEGGEGDLATLDWLVGEHADGFQRDAWRRVRAALSPAPASGGANDDEDDPELPDTPIARTIYKHFCDVHGLHPDEAGDATGELLAALAASPQPGAGEPVAFAWAYRYRSDPTWQLTRNEIQARDKTGEVQPLYTHPASPSAQPAEEGPLREALELTLERIKDWPLDDTETCMCGSPVEGHNIGRGHSPVSQADHARSLLIESIKEALAAAQHDEVAK